MGIIGPSRMKDKINFIIKFFLIVAILFIVLLYFFQSYSQSSYAKNINDNDLPGKDEPLMTNYAKVSLLNISGNNVETTIKTKENKHKHNALQIDYKSIPYSKIDNFQTINKLEKVEKSNSKKIYEEYYENRFAIETAGINNNFDVYKYKIKRGENLSTIAYNKRINIDTIISFNHIVEGHDIPAGRILTLPNQPGILHKIKNGESLSKIAQRYNSNDEAIKEINQIDDKYLIEGQTLFIPNGKLSQNEIREAFIPQYVFPTSGRISSLYGMRTLFGKRGFHPGIDIAANKGTQIRAFRKGRVTLAKYYGGYGYCVFVKHADGLETRYGHMLTKPLVKVGQWVSNGQLLGYIGNTGVSYGYHLHFEIRKNNKTIDPYSYLKKWMKNGNKINQWIKSNYKSY